MRIQSKIGISVFLCLVLAAHSATKNEICSAIAEELDWNSRKKEKINCP